MEPELNNQQEQETEVDLNEKEWTLKKINDYPQDVHKKSACSIE